MAISSVTFDRINAISESKTVKKPCYLSWNDQYILSINATIKGPNKSLSASNRRMSGSCFVSSLFNSSEKKERNSHAVVFCANGDDGNKWKDLNSK